jgi:hypothetical protein
MKLFVTALLLAAGCNADTSRLTPALEQQFAAEGVLHRADNVVFRWTEGGGRTWENRTASIVVTNRTVYIHKNDKVGLRITPDSRKECEVHRDHERVQIALGSGRNAESWSFIPPEDPEVWTGDIRTVLRQFSCGRAGGTR